MNYLYCQNPSCGNYLGCSGDDECHICGWRAGRDMTEADSDDQTDETDETDETGGWPTKVYIVYRKGYEWCETVGVWANKPEADADAAERNKKAEKAKTSKERLSVYTVEAHTVRGGDQ